MQDAGSRTTHGDLGTVRDYASSEHPITTIQNNMQSRVDVECHTDRRAAVCTEMTGNGSSMKLHQYGVISLCLNPSDWPGWTYRTLWNTDS